VQAPCQPGWRRRGATPLRSRRHPIPRPLPARGRGERLLVGDPCEPRRPAGHSFRMLARLKVDQRLRNRMIEAVDSLSDSEVALEGGAAHYFNSFFDFFPDHPSLPDNSALTADERRALTSVLSLMTAAAGSTPRFVTTEQLRASGWPQRVAPVARIAFDLLRERGRFSEEAEEPTPSREP